MVTGVDRCKGARHFLDRCSGLFPRKVGEFRSGESAKAPNLPFLILMNKLLTRKDWSTGFSIMAHVNLTLLKSRLCKIFTFQVDFLNVSPFVRWLGW